MSVAFLFPGQGSQKPGMLHNLPRCAAIADTLNEASEVLGHNVLKLDSENALRSTAAAQLALVISGVAFGRELLTRGATPEIVGGLSVGAFAAAVIADALDFSLALPLVRLRGKLMEEAYPHGYGMAAIMGLDEKQIAKLVSAVATEKDPVFVANLNAPRQIVVSGTETGLQRLMEKAQLAGAQKVQRLNMSVPSHCPLLQEVAQELERAIARIMLRPPKYVYVGNRGGRALRDPVSVRNDLVTNVAHPVRWHDATALMFELGARLFVELPPGRVLTNLASSSFPDARAVACATNRIEAVVQLVLRYHEN